MSLFPQANDGGIINTRKGSAVGILSKERFTIYNGRIK
jgi:hypothetical protein